MTKNQTPSQPLIHPPLVGFAAALLIGTVATDFIYSETLLFQWNNFSIWLLAAGLILAAIAGLALLLDIMRRRLPLIAWGRFIGFTTAALLSLLNAFVHSRDGYTAVVPDGFALSAAAAVILIFLGQRGWSLRAAPSNGPTRTMEFHSGSPEIQS